MSTYLKNHVSTKVSPPQSQPLDSTQVLNSAGGFTWQIDEFSQLRRFLILGTAGGTYYAGESKLTKQNFDVIEKAIAIDGPRVVAEIVDISLAGRAPKNDQAICALAFCIAEGDITTKRLALEALPKVCRIGTHLFMLVDFLDKFGHLSGRAKRNALSAWYNNKDVDKLAYQVVKYAQRGGWSHRDVLRTAHTKAVDGDHAQLYEWITKGFSDKTAILPQIVWGAELAKVTEDPENTAELVRKYNLPREALRTESLTSPVVWQALLDQGMGLTALIRNLGNMTRIGLLTPTSAATKQVVAALSDQEALSQARVHPMNVLFALKTYQSGGGWRSDKTWTPVTKIVDALDGAFYKAFGNVEPTGKRVLLALDVSGSMTSPMGDTNISCRDATAAMALITQNVEDQVEVAGFTSGSSYNSRGRYESEVTSLNISSRQRLDDAIKVISNLPFGGTDCALPMLYAERKHKDFDLFVIYTDNETWAGSIHPAKALKNYRQKTGIDAKLVVVGMTSTGFSIADPNDPGMLDVVGFDSATPQIISDFSCGRI